jgi:transposase-like protein
MGAKAREYDAMIARVVNDAGASIVERGTDGRNHRKVVVRLHDQERTFHYPCSGASHGHGLRNTKQRLRWLLLELKTTIAPVKPLVRASQVFPPPAVIERTAFGASEPTPRRTKLTREKRSEIVKRYSMRGVTIDTIIAEFSLARTTIENLLLATKGSIRSKFEKERNLMRAHSARPAKTARQDTAEAPVITPKKRQYNRRGDNMKRSALVARNRRVFTYCQYGMTMQEVADTMDLTTERVRQIVRQMEKESGNVR